jgi:hypothetical protein
LDRHLAPFAFHGIRSTHRAGEGPGSNASPKYSVSRDENGAIVGIIVASSVRRGRSHMVAPEILREIGQKWLLSGPPSASAPAREVSRPASLLAVAAALSRDSHIAKTYCIPAT